MLPKDPVGGRVGIGVGTLVGSTGGAVGAVQQEEIEGLA